MKILKLVACALMFAAALPMFAENENYQRVTIGYNATFVDPKGGDGETLNGFNAQYNYGFSLSESLPMYLEVGAGLSYGSAKIAEESFKVLSIGVPVNIAYKINLNDAIALTPYTGVNFKVNALGKWGGESIFDKDVLDAKRFQMGWQIGAGVNFNAWYVGLEYGLDFIKIAKEVSTSSLSVKVGYTF